MYLVSPVAKERFHTTPLGSPRNANEVFSNIFYNSFLLSELICLTNLAAKNTPDNFLSCCKLGNDLVLPIF